MANLNAVPNFNFFLKSFNRTTVWYQKENVIYLVQLYFIDKSLDISLWLNLSYQCDMRPERQHFHFFHLICNFTYSITCLKSFNLYMDISHPIQISVLLYFHSSQYWRDGGEALVQNVIAQPAFTRSQSTMETPKQCVKYIQS